MHDIYAERRHVEPQALQEVRVVGPERLICRHAIRSGAAATAVLGEKVNFAQSPPVSGIERSWQVNHVYQALTSISLKWGTHRSITGLN
jgi:hypothetical protein